VRLPRDQMPFGDSGRRSNVWRMAVYILLIGGGVMLTRMVEAGRVKPLFLPTPTATRTADSYVEIGQTYFDAGNLKEAIASYQSAVAQNPDDYKIWSELARVQTYSSELQPTFQARTERLAEARTSIDKAVEINPDDATAYAIRILVYDWSASAAEDDPAQRQLFLSEAETSAQRASLLDPGSLLVQALSAEVSIDQQRFAQAMDNASTAAAQIADDDPYSMDVHRVYGTVLEGNGYYNQAIEEYKKAVDANPNMTFLYLRIGANYRILAGKSLSPPERSNLIDLSLSAFDEAARINEQNGVEDPTPYMAIGRTYLQDGEFFIAATNVQSALAIDPGNAEIYGFLGIVYYKARNYENALSVLQCAIDGCSAQESSALLCDLKVFLCDPEDPASMNRGQEVIGLPLISTSLEFYYTYDSALAAGKECDRADRVSQQLMAAYGQDPIVRDIVGENQAICSGALPFPSPEATQATVTPTP
jgi:tetratricopeptide (TPR) repeat protein